MENYKQEIENTRTGCLGSSDANLLAQVDLNKSVPKSATRRLAVVKGLAKNVNIPQTAAVRAGDDIEMFVYEYLKETYPDAESNPMWVSEKYSRSEVKLISHPDIVIKDEKNKILNVYEVKTTKNSLTETRRTYRNQLFIHKMLGQEECRKLGTGWTVKVFLVHYNTDGLDLENGVVFDTSRLTVSPCSIGHYFNLSNAMDIVNNFLSDLNEYYESDEIDANLLPTEVYNQFQTISDVIRNIKEMEKQVDEFKSKLYDFLSSKGIKKVKNEDFSFSVVAPTQSITVDYKEIFAREIESKHPRRARRLREQFKKVSDKKGYVVIKVNNEDK